LELADSRSLEYRSLLLAPRDPGSSHAGRRPEPRIPLAAARAARPRI
jgi:hypothetical protein